MRVPPKVDANTDAGTTRRARRAERHAARTLLWTASSLPRVRACGLGAVSKDGVTVRATGKGEERRAGFSGLSSCGSVWACSCCATKVLAGRQAEVTKALEAWTEQGGRVVMLTLTMRHREGQRLKTLWDGLSYAWGRVTSGQAWVDVQEAYGAPVGRVVSRGKRKGLTVVENRIGWIRVVEATHGVNGWHVHVHAALLVGGGFTEQQADDLGCALFQTWRDALVSKGLRAPLARGFDGTARGVKAQLWDGKSEVMSEYFTKNEYSADASKAALELARGDIKEARSGHRTPFRILADLGAWGVADDLALWHEWEKGSHKRRQMTWSVGLRERLLPDELEKTDEELAEAADLAGDALLVIPRAGWRKVCWDGLAAQLLDQAEVDDTGDALREFLQRQGIGWKPPGEEPPPR